jgi:hypothetical protein
MALLLVLGAMGGIIMILAVLVVVIVGVLALLALGMTLGMALSLAVAVVVVASLWMSGHRGKLLELRVKSARRAVNRRRAKGRQC